MARLHKKNKAKRTDMRAELARADGRYKHTKAWSSMWARVNSLAGKQFEVAFEMLSGVLREYSVDRLASDEARGSACSYGFAKADNEGWSMDPFIVNFSKDLAAAAA